jgi:hypothetical protein
MEDRRFAKGMEMTRSTHLRTTHLRILVLGLATALAPACGGDDGAGTPGTPDAGTDTDGGGTPKGNDYFPFAAGNSWEYDVVETGKPTERKVQTIVRAEVVGAGFFKDTMAFRVESRRPDGIGDATISWQAREGTKIVRYREQACTAGSVVVEGGSVSKCTVNEEDTWRPARVRIDEQPGGQALVKDMAWDETYTENKTTISPSKSPPMNTTTEVHTSKWTVVEAGSTVMGYSNCVVLRKTSPKETAKTYTFCKGVGKVKEVGAGQTETLVRFSLH